MSAGVMAWRIWRVATDGSLEPPFRRVLRRPAGWRSCDDVWTQGRWFNAKRPRGGHAVPWPTCDCGLYAYPRLVMLRDYWRLLDDGRSPLAATRVRLVGDVLSDRATRFALRAGWLELVGPILVNRSAPAAEVARRYGLETIDVGDTRSQDGAPWPLVFDVPAAGGAS